MIQLRNKLNKLFNMCMKLMKIENNHFVSNKGMQRFGNSQENILDIFFPMTTSAVENNVL